jgi:hypothetical protein
MEDFTLAELGVFLGVLGGIITSLLLTIQKSKCEKIKCFCMECNRKPELKTIENNPENNP